MGIVALVLFIFIGLCQASNLQKLRATVKAEKKCWTPTGANVEITPAACLAANKFCCMSSSAANLARCETTNAKCTANGVAPPVVIDVTGTDLAAIADQKGHATKSTVKNRLPITDNANIFVFEDDDNDWATKFPAWVTSVTPGVGGTAIGTFHFMGHGQVGNVIVDEKRDGATFCGAIAALNPKRVIVWACNTGLKQAIGSLQTGIRAAFDKTSKTSFTLSTTPVRDTHYRESFAFNCAKALPVGAHVYGSISAIQPSGIKGAYAAFTSDPIQFDHWVATGGGGDPNPGAAGESNALACTKEYCCTAQGKKYNMYEWIATQSGSTFTFSSNYVDQ